jgi:hypothetical protein
MRWLNALELKESEQTRQDSVSQHSSRHRLKGASAVHSILGRGGRNGSPQGAPGATCPLIQMAADHPADDLASAPDCCQHCRVHLHTDLRSCGLILVASI